MNSHERVPAQILLLYELKHLLVIHPDKRLQVISPTDPGLAQSVWVDRTTFIPSVLSPRSFEAGAAFCEFNLCREKHPGDCCTTSQLLAHLDKAALFLPSDDPAVIFCDQENPGDQFGIGSFTAERSCLTLYLLPLAPSMH